MEKTTKRIVVSIILEIFLLTACAPASVPPGDSTQAQFILTSAAGTVEAFNANATQTKAVIPTPTVPISTMTSAFMTITGSLGQAAASATPKPGTPTNTPDLEEAAFNTYCRPVLETQVALEEIESVNELESQLEVGKTAIVREPVNLRTRPNLRSRILLVLKPNTEVEVIDGPKKTRLGDGIRYRWWKVQLKGGIIGWAAEMSACRQFYFMAPPNTATPTP